MGGWLKSWDSLSTCTVCLGTLRSLDVPLWLDSQRQFSMPLVSYAITKGGARPALIFDSYGVRR